VNAFKQGNTIRIPDELAIPEGGKPQTILLIGADRRAPGAVDYDPTARSDTMMLVRLNPNNQTTNLMSLPRDLKVSIPGHGVDKLNAAYSLGGVKLTVQTIKQLTGLSINHVINIDFRGFRKAINALHCVYVDIDRRYYNQGGGYAKINVQPGYQKMCGETALDYVRYRHTDNDIIRAARQQDFLRAMKTQLTVGKLINNRDKLIKIFGQYTQSDIGSSGRVVDLLKLVLASASHPIREVHFEAKLGPSFVTASETSINRLAHEFLSSPPAPSKSPRKKKGKRHGGHAKSTAGLADMTSSGKQIALQAVSRGARNLDILYPRYLQPGSRYVAPPRSYTVKSPSGTRYHAYRFVIATGQIGEYYGLQGISWTKPPILRSPSEVKTIRGRQFMIFRDGARTRRIAWHWHGASYWISNTLSEDLSEGEMLAIARTTKPL
jgi:LCP family protein required for cell wall assembly